MRLGDSQQKTEKEFRVLREWKRAIYKDCDVDVAILGEVLNL